MNLNPGTPVAVFTCSKEAQMEFSSAARTILTVTALAWRIPLTQAGVKNSLLLRNGAIVPSHT
jgi:hypothetical protein